MERIKVLYLAALFGLLAATVGAVPVAAQEVEPPRTVIFGAHPTQSGGQTRVEAAENLQAALGGPQLGAIRRYLIWEDEVAGDPLIEWTLAQGSIPLISIVPARPDGSRVPWADIAGAVEGEAVYDELMAHAAAIAALEGEVWFAFQHEPEIVANIPHGEDLEFIAAYQRFVTEITNAGATNVKFIWVMTAYAFELPTTDRRSAEHWYPGDEWVDLLGADPYNWSDCRANVNTPWKSFEELATPFRDFALQRPDKGVVIAEFGSVEDPNNATRKADWITDIRVMLREPGWEQVVAMLTFNAKQPAPDGDCAWFTDTSPESAAAYTALVNDEVFGGTGGPPEGPPPAPDPTCVSAVVDSEAVVSWEHTTGTQVLRRNDKYLASVPAGESSYVDANPLTESTYVLRLWIGGSFTDLDCGTVTVGGPGPTECSAVITGENQVSVTWSDTPEREILRRNDAWLNSPSAGANEYVDQNPADGTNTYSLRIWVGQQFTDIDCGSVEITVGAPQCTVVVADQVVEVTWSPVLGGTVVIRRDGSWVATAPNGSSSWTGTEPEGGPFTYTLRNWVSGGYTDIDCLSQ